MSLSYGFTGTQEPPLALVPLIFDVVRALPQDATYVVGCCIGIDALVARVVMQLGRRVHAVVPWDRSKVDAEWRLYCTTFEEMPEPRRWIDRYKERNARIVALGKNGLIGFPRWPEEDGRSMRSGTWQTIRIARRAGISVRLYPLWEL
jgi:hypothetical protein